MELIEGKMWTHEGSEFHSQVDDHKTHMVEFSEARVLAAMQNATLSSDEWDTAASCCHCDEKGYICPD